MMGKEIRVFVYGSLKEGFSNHSVLRGADRVSGTYRLSGAYRMISLGAFPGVVQDPAVDMAVMGEVYKVDANGLASLDMLEGNGSFYTRRKVKTDCGLRVWCYFLPLDEYADEESVEDGVWTEDWCVSASM